MRKATVLLCFCLFVSCDWFFSKEEKTQQLVQEEMRSIDFNEVDRYPLFKDCDEMLEKTAQLECFQTILIAHFSETLQEFEFHFVSESSITIYVDFLVDNQGQISVLEVEKNTLLDQQIPEFSTIITQSLKGLPKLSPALKRGVPVTAKFRIPIILNAI